MLVWIQNPFDNLPLEGRRAQRYWLMSKAFVSAGHGVVLWTGDFSHADKAKRKLADKAPAGEAGIEVRFVPTRPYTDNVSFARVASHLAYAREWRRLAFEAAGSGRPDVIITSVPTLSSASAAIDLGRRLGAKVVADIMDAWPETFYRLLPEGLRFIGKIAFFPMRLAARRVYREADGVSGVCERYRGLAARADYHLAYHGIAMDDQDGSAPDVRARRRDRGRGLRLVYIGSAGRTYDLETVKSAVRSLDGATLDIAGTAAGRDEECIRYRGYLGKEELESLLAGSDAGIVPMSADSWVGLPYKLCDYVKARLPVVNSLSGECADFICRHGIGTNYRPGDVAGCLEAIRAAGRLDVRAFESGCDAALGELDAGKIYRRYVCWVESLKERQRGSI